MESVNQKKDKLHQLVDTLPTDRLDDAEALLQQLGEEPRFRIIDGKRIVKLGGLWQDLDVDISEEDIAEARREMWGGIAEEDI